jgi:hypothetical protein
MHYLVGGQRDKIDIYILLKVKASNGVILPIVYEVQQIVSEDIFEFYENLIIEEVIIG